MNDWATRNINSFFSSTQVYQSPGQITFHAPKHVSVNLRGQKLQKAIKKKMLKLEINYKKKNWKKTNRSMDKSKRKLELTSREMKMKTQLLKFV